MTYTINNTLTEILLKNFKAYTIFERYNINYCIEGSRTIEEACNMAEVDAALIMNELRDVGDMFLSKIKVNEWSLDFLCEYIANNHHTFIRKALPDIALLAKEIFKHDRNKDISDKYEKLISDFEIHMQKEEKLLFPYIKKLVNSEKSSHGFEIEPFGLICKPIEVLKKEHLTAMEKLFALKNNNSAPKRSYLSGQSKYYTGLLTEFEYDLHIHLHLENNILFPKAQSLEKKILKRSSKKDKNKSK